jgi:DNA-binding NtrC family response regulator
MSPVPQEIQAAHVLIVEDEDATRTVLERTLTRAGFNVLVARHGEEASGLASIHRATLRVVLTDIVLPGASGTQLAEALEELAPRARVILMSGYPREEVLSEDDRKLFFIQKPFTSDDLIAVVRYAMSAASESAAR